LPQRAILLLLWYRTTIKAFKAATGQNRAIRKPAAPAAKKTGKKQVKSPLTALFAP